MSMLVCDAAQRTVRVEVTGTHPALPACPPPTTDVDGDTDGGRGLVLVDAMADR